MLAPALEAYPNPVSGVRRSCAMSSPTPAISWMSVSTSPSIRLTLTASGRTGRRARGSASARADRRPRCVWIRRLTPERRLRARKLSNIPMPTARPNAGSNSSQAPRRRFRDLADLVDIPPDHEISPPGSGCATRRTFCISRPRSSTRTTRASVGTSAEKAPAAGSPVAGDGMAVGSRTGRRS